MYMRRPFCPIVPALSLACASPMALLPLLLLLSLHVVPRRTMRNPLLPSTPSRQLSSPRLRPICVLLLTMITSLRSWVMAILHTVHLTLSLCCRLVPSMHTASLSTRSLLFLLPTPFCLRLSNTPILFHPSRMDNWLRLCLMQSIVFCLLWLAAFSRTVHAGTRMALLYGQPVAAAVRHTKPHLWQPTTPSRSAFANHGFISLNRRLIV